MRQPEFSLSFLQTEHLEQSIATICNYAGKDPGGRLWPAISALQHPDLLALSPDGDVSAVWYEGLEDSFSGALGVLMGGVDTREVATPYPADGRAATLREFDRTLDTLARRFPATFASFRKIIRHVVFARREGYSGGTVSSRIGLIWLAPEPGWTPELWLENLIHEFVHNTLFIEDMIYRLLVAGGDRLEYPDALAMSAIRQVKRGYDKSYHSAFVSFTVVEMYRSLGRLDLAEPFVPPLLVCLEDLVAKREFATPHGQDLLLELVEAALPIYR